MSEHIFALVVHERAEPFDLLKRALRDLAVETYSVATCKDAADLITHCRPQIIFADSAVSDGSWVSVSNLAEQAEVPASIIVVGSVPNTKLYLSVMERGAFDFIAPPFEHEPLNFVVRSAALNAHSRRERTVQAAYAR